MDTRAVRDLVRQIEADRAESAAKLRQYDSVLTNLRELYPQVFTLASREAEPAEPARSLGIVADPDLIEAAKFTRAIVPEIFRRAPDDWLTPKEVTSAAMGLGWTPPEGSPDPVAVIRNHIGGMDAELEWRNRDGRTKEYRLKTPATGAGTPAAGSALSSDQKGGDAPDVENTQGNSDPAPGWNSNDRDRGASIA